MNKKIRSFVLAFIMVSVVLLSSQFLVLSVPSAVAAAPTDSSIRTAPIGSTGVPSAGHNFTFVSNFEDMKLDGWTVVSGSTPTVVTSPNYSGEPVLNSSANSGSQVDYATKGFKLGQSAISFEVAMNAGSGTKGYFGIGSSDSTFVAVVGVVDGKVYAGASLSSLKEIEAVPKNTAYPKGWVYIIADIVLTSGKWTMQVYIDQTYTINTNINVPNAGKYTGALIETDRGTIYYTDIIVSTYQMAINISGYNNMEGYGQGSDLYVRLLPAYNNLTAVMTLTKWSVPQSGILSFQINAMNFTGTTQNTCVGFFQLGMSLDQSGQISPWYVPGVDCEAQGFVNQVSTPPGTQLVLSILFKPSSHEITFIENDITISKKYEVSIPYNGGAFYAAYTQMEFQPCCNSYKINDYKLSGSIFGLEITTTSGKTMQLPASYMTPFELDTPTSWLLEYYQGTPAGYNESSI